MRNFICLYSHVKFNRFFHFVLQYFIILNWKLELTKLTWIISSRLIDNVKSYEMKCTDISHIQRNQSQPKQGFWYFAEKKAKFRGIFRGKFAEKSADFAGFSREKSQNSQKNWPISRDFRGSKVKISRKIGRFRGILAEKRQISKDFQGQMLRKIGRFHGQFRGEASPRNNQ